jgi:topoisomerase-4 subunit B
MDARSRILLRVKLPDVAAALGINEGINDEENPLESAPSNADIDDLVDRLMGKNAEPRFRFIQDNAKFASDIDV